MYIAIDGDSTGKIIERMILCNELDELAKFIITNNLYSKSPIQIYNEWTMQRGAITDFNIQWILDFIAKIIHTDKDILSQSLNK